MLRTSGVVVTWNVPFVPQVFLQPGARSLSPPRRIPISSPLPCFVGQGRTFYLDVPEDGGPYKWLKIGGCLRRKWPPIGRRGFSLNYAVRECEAQVELYTDLGKGCEGENKRIRRDNEGTDDCEAVFRGRLDWQDLPDNRACHLNRSGSGSDALVRPPPGDMAIRTCVRAT